MQRSILATAFSGVMLFNVSASFAEQHAHGGGPSVKTQSVSTHGSTASHGQSATHGPAAKPAGGSTHGSRGASSHGSSGATSHGSSGATTHGSSGATTHGSHAGGTHSSGAETAKSSHAPKTGASAVTTTKSATTSPAPVAGVVTLTPVQQKLQRNTNLADKLRTRLPAGTDLMTASAGFKNLGQFVAAVNVSNNLGLKFADLKTHMVTDGMSLGQSIQSLKSTANVDTEVHRAEQQASTMITSSTSTAGSTTTSTTTDPTAAPAKRKTKTLKHESGATTAAGTSK